MQRNGTKEYTGANEWEKHGPEANYTGNWSLTINNTIGTQVKNYNMIDIRIHGRPVYLGGRPGRKNITAKALNYG